MATTLDWYGCATFRLRTAGLTVFLDAYIDRASNAAGPGLSADDVNEADWVLVGHSHFDHLYGAERILANTDATLIASYESVRLMAEAGVPAERMICVAGGETVDLSRGGRGGGVRVSVYPSQHSCVWSHTQMDQPDEVCLGDLGVTWQEQQQRLAELMSYLTSEVDPATSAHIAVSAAGHSDRGDGGALLYLIEAPEGSVLFQDTSGHWSGVMGDLRPDVAILAAAGRGNIDGEPIQGSLAQFIGRQADMLQPRKIILGHHDNWLPGFSVATDTTSIAAELARVTPNAELLEPGYLESTKILP
ncbi:MBL fold metallo-hydrolase [Candidatus Poriferisodalis sp.]|uniref:MBL fold metallo-hydrolase n=1 Tax=Candidatus Poriferisodalis sp. TaxID=3101277 RepID=UPI003B024FC2